MSIPIIASRVEANELDQNGRPILGTGLDVTVYENQTGTAEKAPYLLTIKSTGTIDAAQFAAIAATRSRGDEAAFRRFMNACAEVIAELFDDYGAIRAETPFGVIETRIAGSVENPQATIDPDENYAYPSLTPDDALVKAIRALAFYNATATSLDFAAYTVRKHDEGSPFTAGDILDIRGRNLKNTCTVAVERNGVTTQCVTGFIGQSLVQATLPSSLAAGKGYVMKLTQDGDTVSVGAPFEVLAAPLPPNPHRITGVSQEGQAEGYIDFDEENPLVLTGEGLADVQSAVIKVYPDGYDSDPEAGMEQNEPEELTSTATQISFKYPENTTSYPDGAYWGKLAKIVCSWADGLTAEIPVTFKSHQG